MAKFNVVQKKMRAQKAERKRAIHGDPLTGKLKVKPQNQCISGKRKRKRKLLRKWSRDQKEAAEKGLLTIQDVEIAVADVNKDLPTADGDNGGGEGSGHKTSTKFPMKKAVKLKKLKRRGKAPKPAASQVSADAMVE